MENVITCFDLLHGVKRILIPGQSWINLELFSQAQEGYYCAPGRGYRLRINQLTALNEQTKANGDGIHHRINKEVIEHLRHWFMELSCSPDPGPVLAWLAAVDKEFVDSWRLRRPFSLLVLAYWGLLLKKLYGQQWWARNSGKAFVGELLDALDPEDLLWKSCLTWVKQKISSNGLEREPDVTISSD
jgi:hypothetical protein